MTQKTLSVAVQYTRKAEFVAHVRPYEVKSTIRSEVHLWLSTLALAEPGHHRVELQALVQGRTADGILCYEASCIVEGIVATSGLEDQELDEALRNIAAPSVMGTVRAVLTSVSAGAGYQPVVLPPLPVDAVAKLPPPPDAAIGAAAAAD